MKVVVFKEGKEHKAVLTDANKNILINFYESISDVYDFAEWATNKYKTLVKVEFLK